VTGDTPIAVLLQSISVVSVFNPLVAFYDIHGGKREVLFFHFVPDTTQDFILCYVGKIKLIVYNLYLTLSYTHMNPNLKGKQIKHKEIL
jgi:hypothetical protein